MTQKKSEYEDAAHFESVAIGECAVALDQPKRRTGKVGVGHGVVEVGSQSRNTLFPLGDHNKRFALGRNEKRGKEGEGRGGAYAVSTWQSRS